MGMMSDCISQHSTHGYCVEYTTQHVRCTELKNTNDPKTMAKLPWNTLDLLLAHRKHEAGVGEVDREDAPVSSSRGRSGRRRCQMRVPGMNRICSELNGWKAHPDALVIRTSGDCWCAPPVRLSSVSELVWQENHSTRCLQSLYHTRSGVSGEGRPFSPVLSTGHAEDGGGLV